MATRRIEVAPAQRTNPWPWIAFLCLLGAALWLLTRPEPIPPVVDASYPAVVPAGTIEVNVNAVLQLPTATATTLPTATVQAAATMDVHADDCNRITPAPVGGQACRQAPYPTNTPAPMSECPVAPGDLCRWPANDETTGNQEDG